jgi:hypothetical protein
VTMRVFVILSILMVAGCSTSGQNLIIAQDSRHQLIGLSADKITACMGKPQGRFTYGSTEVWQYNSRGPNSGAANAQAPSNNAMGAGAPVANGGYCVVNIAMSNREVQSVSYSGLTGVLPQDEQCASAVKACLPQ